MTYQKFSAANPTGLDDNVILRAHPTTGAAQKADPSRPGKYKHGDAEVTRVRVADENHRVVTTTGGDAIYRYEPCSGCPWRTDQVGLFPAEAFRLSARTVYDRALPTFACHESGQRKPAICAGFLLRGASHNLSVRVMGAQGKLDFDAIHDGGHRLHESYRAMAMANGVDANDPALDMCRD